MGTHGEQSREFKFKIMELHYQQKISIKILSEKFGIPQQTVYGWSNEYRKYGNATFVGCGHQRPADAELWTDIVAVSAGDGSQYGLKKNGTVVTAGNDLLGQDEVNKRKNITAISAGSRHIVGLKSDGTVVESDFERGVSGWKNIVAVCPGFQTEVGLESDGTVVATGLPQSVINIINSWKDIQLPTSATQ